MWISGVLNVDIRNVKYGYQKLLDVDIRNVKYGYMEC